MSVGFEPWRPLSRTAGTIALVVSVGLHVGLARLNPDLMFGRGGPPAGERSPSRRTVHMADMRVEPSREELRRLVDRFGLSDSRILPELEDPVLPEAETGSIPEPTPESLADAVNPAVPDITFPTLPEPESDWRPFQEVLTISEDRVREELAVVPRTLRPVTGASPRAPDLNLPMEWEGKNLEFPAPASWDLESATVRRGVAGSASGTGIGGADARLPDISTEVLWVPPPPELDATPLEPPGDITEMQAVERLLRLRAQSFVDLSNPEHRYFKVQVVRGGIEELPVMPRQVIFMLDASAGMTTAMLREAARGVGVALESLSPEDTFNIITFREQVEPLFSTSQPADAVRIANARGHLTQLRAHGRADILASLQSLEAFRQHDPDRPLVGILVTDGVPTAGLTDSTEILERFTRDNAGNISIFSVGGGRRVNRYLIDYLSYRNRGESLVAEQARQLPEAIARTAAQIRRPVMSDLSYRFTDAEDLEIYPQKLAHLYLDRSLILVGRVPADRREVAFQIVGTSGSGRHDMIFTLNLAELPQGPWSLRQEWAWQALLHRIGEYLGDRSPGTLRAIRDLSRSYGISVPYADLLDGTP